MLDLYLYMGRSLKIEALRRRMMILTIVFSSLLVFSSLHNVVHAQVGWIEITV